MSKQRKKKRIEKAKILRSQLFAQGHDQVAKKLDKAIKKAEIKTESSYLSLEEREWLISALLEVIVEDRKRARMSKKDEER